MPKPFAVASLLLAVFPGLMVAQNDSAPSLSTAENAAINHKIAAMKSPTDRSVAIGWTDAKKVAEYLCRPAALPVVKKQLDGADRVFLGTDDPKTLTLVSNAKLTGTGSARYSGGWKDFTFTCVLDSATAKVTSFEATMSPASSK